VARHVLDGADEPRRAEASEVCEGIDHRNGRRRRSARKYGVRHLPEDGNGAHREVIDNNLNHRERRSRFRPKMMAKGKGRILVLSSRQAKYGTKDAARVLSL
jgi:hypothetical protein